jgi:transcription initiation factor TFIIB
MSETTRRRVTPEEPIEREEESTPQRCPECESSTFMQSKDRGELVCGDCGLVLEEGQIDYGPEWRAFNQQERNSKSRVGSPTTKTMHDNGLTTSIDWKNQDTSGRMLSLEKRSQMYRLRKWQKRIRTKDAKERNLQFALSEIDRMSSALGVPRSVREVASVLYRRAPNDERATLSRTT